MEAQHAHSQPITDSLLFRFVVGWQSSRSVHYFELIMCGGMCLGLAVLFDFGPLAPVVKFLPRTLKLFRAQGATKHSPLVFSLAS